MNEASPTIDKAPPQPAAEGASPFLAQYLALKERYREFLLFFRMGDFYELFFGDAVDAAGILDIALTKRGRHHGEDIPMCGVPVHAADGYLARLIRAGRRVAICEQLEDSAEARKRGARAIVRRDVIRIVTPGTLSEDSLLEPARHNYLAALARAAGGAEWALAWLDVSTGDCRVKPTRLEALASDLARVAPGELVLADSLLADPALAALVRGEGWPLAPLPLARFDSDVARRRLAEIYGVATLDGFGPFARAELAALGALLDYVGLTQQGGMPRLKPPVRETESDVLHIDAATRRNLELVEGADGGRRGSLLECLDETLTSGGARLLREWLLAPLADPAQIAARQDALSHLLEAPERAERLAEGLRRVPDLARALQRLVLGRGGPRDLAALREGLAEAGQIARDLAQTGALTPLPPLLEAARGRCLGFEALVDLLARALGDHLPPAARDGGFVRAGYAAPLDELRALRDESRRVIAGLEERYRAETGVASLKVRHNHVLGYYIEVTQVHADRLMAPPLAERFIHRQTLASAVRFSTATLADLDQRIARAAAEALEQELEIFRSLCAAVLSAADTIGAAADALALIDVAAALAGLARARGWVRPRVDATLAFRIEAGRHPVVERALERRAGAAFVANDCDLSGIDGAGQLWLVTGPNMAGKSTFLRQNALIAVLAQMGSFVPARAAHVGIVDRLFSRVGAADDLARGRSTFMVEMTETAAILNQAGPRALVILDEIGRGTATFDGLSIAWATLEHLEAINRTRGLFATHYHELTGLADRLARVSPVTMRVREWQGDIVFLHEVAAGAADRSYGIHVAKLAGLPAAVLARARAILAELEAGDPGHRAASLLADLPLFSAAARPAEPAPSDAPGAALIARLAALHVDDLSPRDALSVLYELVALARDLKPSQPHKS